MHLVQMYQRSVHIANMFSSFSYLLRGIFHVFMFLFTSVEENHDPYMLCDFGNCHCFYCWRNPVLNLCRCITEMRTHSPRAIFTLSNTHTHKNTQNQSRTVFSFLYENVQSRSSSAKDGSNTV